jgi:hypothetical protein
VRGLDEEAAALPVGLQVDPGGERSPWRKGRT